MAIRSSVKRFTVGGLLIVLLAGVSGCAIGPDVHLTEQQLVGTWVHQDPDGHTEKIVFDPDHSAHIDRLPATEVIGGTQDELDVEGQWSLYRVGRGGPEVTIDLDASGQHQRSASLFQTGTSFGVILSFVIGDPDQDDYIEYKKEN